MRIKRSAIAILALGVVMVAAAFFAAYAFIFIWPGL
jgi:hypothetical protein